MRLLFLVLEQAPSTLHCLPFSVLCFKTRIRFTRTTFSVPAHSNQLQSKCQIIWKVIGFQLVHCPVVQREVLSQVLNQLGIVARNCFPHQETMYDAAENEISYFLSKVICDDYRGISMIVQGHFQKRVQTEGCIDSTLALAQDRELRRRA